MEKIVQLLQTGGLRTPIDHAIPTGEASYRQPEHLHAEGRRLVACGDRESCPRGLTSMLDNHRSHIARQKFRALARLRRP